MKAPSSKLEPGNARALINLTTNVVYEQVPSRGYASVPMRMDIYQPESSMPLPAVIYITGGGFINANKDSYVQHHMALAEAGFVVASIEYRLAPAVIFPAPLEDVKAAVRFLRAHSEQFGIDKTHIGVMGGSAGGYLAAICGTSNGRNEFDKGDHLEESSDIQAVVDIFGLSDLTKVGDDFSPEVQQTHHSAGATEALWVNGSPVFGGLDGGIFSDRERAERANPMTYISSATPPFLLMHGDADTLVSPSQTDLLHQALTNAGIESTRYIVEGAIHGGPAWVQKPVMDIVTAFLHRHLK